MKGLNISTIEVDFHFIREKITSKMITAEFVKSADQLANIFTKSLDQKELCNILFNLEMITIFNPT